MRLVSSSFLLIILSPLLAQVSIPGQPTDIIDKFDSTRLSLYSSIYEKPAETLDVLDQLIKFTENTGYPRGYNDGPVWKGSDLTVELHGGIRGKVGKLNYTIHPVVFFSTNTAFFDTPDSLRTTNEFAYHFSNKIDWVQRYGRDPLLSFNPGQSEISMDWNSFSASVSTQNYSLGPSVFNPIILSRQAAGIPMVRLSLKPTRVKTKKVDFGIVEVNYLVGLLKESDYFDENDENDNRFFNALTFAYSPKFLPELTLGFNKVLYKQTQFFEPEDFLSAIHIVGNGVINGDTLSPNDTFDQLASLTLEWKMPKNGFRVYTEFAKNDFTGSKLRFFLVEPEHSRAYTIGFEKRLKTKKGKDLIILYEHTNLSRGHTYLWRATPSFYQHAVNRQGYTNNGQVVGAGIGPGGNSDHLSVRRIGDKYDLGLLVQRIEHNKDYHVVNIQDPFLHDVEYTVTFNSAKKINAGRLFFEFAFSNTYNRYYIWNDVQNIMISGGFQLDL